MRKRFRLSGTSRLLKRRLAPVTVLGGQLMNDSLLRLSATPRGVAKLGMARIDGRISTMPAKKAAKRATKKKSVVVSECPVADPHRCVCEVCYVGGV